LQLHLQLSYRLITITQYVLIVILASITLQVVFTGGYSSLLMKSVIWINYVVFIVLIGLLSQRFLSWSISNRNKVVIAYGVSMAVLSVSGIFTILYVTNTLSGQRGIDYIGPLRSPLAIVASVFKVSMGSVAKNIQNKTVKNYLVISAYGMVLLFTANQPVSLDFKQFLCMDLKQFLCMD